MVLNCVQGLVQAPCKRLPSGGSRPGHYGFRSAARRQVLVFWLLRRPLRLVSCNLRSCVVIASGESWCVACVRGAVCWGMVRYLLSNSGSAQSLRQHASASMRLGRKFSSFDSDLSTLSGASSLVSSLSVAVAPYGGGTIGASQASHIASSDAASAISALRESGPIARALCKNCSYVFLCAYSPSGPDFCSIDCR